MQQSDKHGPLQDEQLAHEVQGLVQGGHRSRAEEWREDQFPGEDQPDIDRNIVPEDRRATPPGMDFDDVETRSELARFIGRHYPATKAELVQVAADNEATDEVMGHLQRLPEGSYENVQQVAEALGLGTESQRF